MKIINKEKFKNPFIIYKILDLNLKWYKEGTYFNISPRKILVTEIFESSDTLCAYYYGKEEISNDISHIHTFKISECSKTIVTEFLRHDLIKESIQYLERKNENN